MTPALAQEYIKRRMQELGYGEKYHMRLRHLILQPEELRTLRAYTSYFVLVEEPLQIRIQSQNGFFDLTSTNANEMVYEHHGKIRLSNTEESPARVRFIEVIPYT